MLMDEMNFKDKMGKKKFMKSLYHLLYKEILCAFVYIILKIDKKRMKWLNFFFFIIKKEY